MNLVDRNIFAPQSIEAQYELEEIADLKLQIITPQSSTPIIAMKQDQLIGVYNMTSEYYKLDWRTTMNLLSSTYLDDLPNISKKEDYWGKEIYSHLIPKKINLLKGPVEKPTILVKNGIMEAGILGDDSLGVKKPNSLIQLVWDEYGVEKTKTFLDNTTKLANNFNLYHGMTVGIKDMYVSDKLYEKMQQVFDTKKLEVQHEITEIENNPDMMDADLFEKSVNQKLSVIREDVSKVIMGNMSKDNNFRIMIQSGSKGKDINITQMAGLVGQQDFHNKRILKNFNNRSLPYFFQNDDRAGSRGFIERPFMRGLDLTEFIFHHLSSREGLIDQTVRSVTPDTRITIIEDSKPKTVEIGSWIDSHIAKTNPELIEHDVNEFELVKVNGVQIPTVNEVGKVTWANVTAVTRHGKGKQLFEIVTRGGRKVKVPESKSLLIWNKETKKFEDKLTTDVLLGDFVPVTFNLPKPDIEINNITINKTNYKLNYENGKQLASLMNMFEIDSVKNYFDEQDLFDLICSPDDFIKGFNENFNENSIKNYDEKYIIIINTLLNRAGLVLDLNNKKIIYDDSIKQSDIILDEIIQINLIPAETYPKLYDLTVPVTNNFIIASGMGVYDTAESGYIQRKLIKSTEDFMVNYDGTVRNAVGRIQQFIYGESGADTIKQYQYKFQMMEMSNSEIADKFKLSKDEMAKVKNFTDADNNKLYNNMLKYRDHLRVTQMKSTLEYKTLNASYMLPVNLYRIINNIRNDTNKKGDTNMDAKFILDLIDKILESKNTRLYCLTEEERKNPNSVKYIDDQMAKTAFKYALLEILSPKKCIFTYKFSKEQLEEISEEIISSFNSSIVEPGEMVGIIAAQSLGEPVTQLMLNAFHSSGVGGKGGSSIGVDRIKEVFSLSKNPKEPIMMIYLDLEHRTKKDFANKIASHIKFTTIKDLRTKIEIFYDPKPYGKGSFMEADNIKTIFYTYQQNKQCCSNTIDGLPWLMRIEFDKEKLLNKEVSLLDIKSQFCFSWERRYQDIKAVKREKRQLLEKISQLAVLSNTDNDDIPTVHIRFDMTNFDSTTIIDFMDMFVDEFKLKGMENIDDILGGKAQEERYICFDNPDSTLEKKSEYVVYTRGVNMDDIRNIIGVDLTRTYCNDIITVYEIFGIEAARNLIIREIISVLTSNGSGTNYQHICMFGDLMTNVGSLTSIDRHGLNKLDTDPFSRASFEKTVDQLITAAVFNEVDYMKSVSSRIMAGLCIKGGTGLCNLILDKDLLENAEYTIDIGQLYKKTYDEITVQPKQEIDSEVFIPDF